MCFAFFRKLWERFIELCHQNGSLFGITWNHLRAQLDGVELKKTYILNPLAPEFVPNRMRHGVAGDAGAQPQPVGVGKFGYAFLAPPGWVPRQVTPGTNPTTIPMATAPFFSAQQQQVSVALKYQTGSGQVGTGNEPNRKRLNRKWSQTEEA